MIPADEAQSIGCHDVQFPPFEPPQKPAFEPELEGEPPRPIPPELRMGRHARRERLAGGSLLVIGLLCAVCGPLPIVKTWGIYIPLLEFLTWIGLACAAMGTVILLSQLSVNGPYRYVTDGIPIVARVRELVLRPTWIVNGSPTKFQFAAAIEYRDPATNEMVITESESSEFSSVFRDELTTSYRVGDYATAVYLPSNPANTVRLYGFLDLRPGLGVVRRDGKQGIGVLQTIQIILALFGFFAILGWNIYALARYSPVEWSVSQQLPPFVIGALLHGGCVLGFLAYDSARAQKKLVERNERAVATGEAIELQAHKKNDWFGRYGVIFGLIIIIGALLLGGCIGLSSALTLNANFDRSELERHPVQITEFVQINKRWMFREFNIKYHFLEAQHETHSFLSTPEHMMEFDNDLAIAEVQSGWFGWRWVKEITPVRH